MSRVSELLAGRRAGIHIPAQGQVASRVDSGGDILVNLDRSFNPGGFTFAWTRRQLLWRGGDHVIPVAFTPLDRPIINRRSIRLIERRGRECVFQAEDDRSGDVRYFLSGFDRNEWPRSLYFLAELPRAVTSIKDARQALKPPSVVEAEKMGRRVYRQGDMFAIPTKITTEEILAQGGIIESREVEGGWGTFISRSVRARSLYGTAHTATQVASMPDGTQLAYDTLYHEPRLVGRLRRDHKPCPLKWRRWHLVARNTVPIRKPTPTRAGVRSDFDLWLDSLARVERRLIW